MADVEIEDWEAGISYEIERVVLKRGTDSCYVILDNGERFVINVDIVVGNVLEKGKEITGAELAEILKKQRVITVKKDAYRIATNKPRSEFQMVQKLKERKYEQDEIALAIKFLYEFKLLNDLGFAKSFVANKLITKRFGLSRMRIELKRTGVSKEVIDEALASEFPNDEVEIFQLALEAAERKLRLIANKDAVKKRNSMIQFLTRQGFTWKTINRVCEKILN
ncbi:MAG: regulatory protein RecX [Candidatus Kapabacteria bacterium]|nr:regulatory protein RecX [Candidatus Kapabacteria bacterium]